MSDAETKTCPVCAEDVKAAALKCRHCGFYFEPEVPAPTAMSGLLEVEPVRLPR